MVRPHVVITPMTIFPLYPDHRNDPTNRSKLEASSHSATVMTTAVSESNFPPGGIIGPASAGRALIDPSDGMPWGGYSTAAPTPANGGGGGAARLSTDDGTMRMYAVVTSASTVTSCPTHVGNRGSMVRVLSPSPFEIEVDFRTRPGGVPKLIS